MSKLLSNENLSGCSVKQVIDYLEKSSIRFNTTETEIMRMLMSKGVGFHTADTALRQYMKKIIG